MADEPANYDLRMGYAHALRDRKQYPAAATQFHEAAKIKPAETKTWTELGGMLYLSGDHPGRPRRAGRGPAGWAIIPPVTGS
ncbi:MAG: hypothetical protein WDO73_21400 [Ignavibacteriota bacterium]